MVISKAGPFLTEGQALPVRLWVSNVYYVPLSHLVISISQNIPHFSFLQEDKHLFFLLPWAELSRIPLFIFSIRSGMNTLPRASNILPHPGFTSKTFLAFILPLCLLEGCDMRLLSSWKWRSPVMHSLCRLCDQKLLHLLETSLMQGEKKSEVFKHLLREVLGDRGVFKNLSKHIRGYSLPCWLRPGFLPVWQETSRSILTELETTEHGAAMLQPPPAAGEESSARKLETSPRCSRMGKWETTLETRRLQ